MPKKPKRHHIVPQFLLKLFLEKDATTIFLYDKLQDKTEQRNPKNTMVFSNFNTIGESTKLEEFYGQIESDSAPVIRKLIKQKSFRNIKHAEKKRLFYFVLMQHIRTFIVRQAIEDMSRSCVFQAIQIMESEGKLSDPKKIKIADWIREGLVEIEIDKDHIRQEVANLRIYFSKQLPYLMENKKFLLFHSESPSFYISDSGVVLSGGSYNGGAGINSPGIEIYLPLSSRIMLAIVDQSLHPHLDENNFLSIPKKILEKHNELQTLWAERYIVCAQDNFELAKEALAEYPDSKIGTMRKLKIN